VRGKIALHERMLEGRALARLTDLGWGNTVRALFAASTPDAPASPAVLAACVRVLAEWRWDERPAAVVSVPSRAHPQLVDSVAHGLADAGRLPYLGALSHRGDGPTGASGGNSAYRLASVWEAFTVEKNLADLLAAANGPVLLVDDLADSRWTLTVAARLLRLSGASDVLPFALALAG
jgi:ATP-dependent DNA helicase RecQ